MNRYRIIILLLTFILVVSCEEVVEIDLEENKARLVIEASLYRIKGSNSNLQQLKLSKSVPFYEEVVPPVEDAEVKIISEDNEVFVFDHSTEGFYRNTRFTPVADKTYRLEIDYQEELYTATETMIPVTSIDSVTQNKSGGFSGNEIELKAHYSDPSNQPNYYLFRFTNQKSTLEIYEDEFTDGNQIFGYYSNEDIEPGDEIRIEMAGISRSYYDYLFILKSQIGSGAGPFEAQPSTVKGNIVNQTNRENFPYGFFRLSEVDTTIYIVN